ncbi:MAG: NAD(P)/FAD-dependent oxidoreductase [Spirochaetales bacterium]|nr:NAD(P)/FAD-dependent oxidoreductase [Spirochaetales bacterium]
MTEVKPDFDLLIIGAGPAGLFAAIQCHVPGRRIAILEKNRKAGRKLLVSGSGQCNITHAGPVSEFLDHYGNNGEFLKPALRNFNNEDLIAFFRERNIELEEREDGKIFPKNRRAADILQVLLDECRRNKVSIFFNSGAEKIEYKDNLFLIKGKGGTFTSKLCLLATGGKSYPATGSTGDGYAFARQLGHSVVDPRPALVQITADPYPFNAIAGVALPDCAVSLWRNGRKFSERRGEVLFTHSGLSGPAALNLSRYIMKRDCLKLCFLPRFERKQFETDLLDSIRNRGRSLLKNLLGEFGLPKSLAEHLLFLLRIDLKTTANSLSKESRNKIVNALFEFEMPVKPSGDFNAAMATAGGIALSEIDKNKMESRIVPGLYFAGEVMDIDGDTGGYNLQAAFSTAALTASAIKRQWGKCSQEDNATAEPADER